MLFARSTTYPQLVAVLFKKAAYLKTLVDDLRPPPLASEIGEMLRLAPWASDPSAGFSFRRMRIPQHPFPANSSAHLMFLSGMVIWVSKGPAPIKDDSLSCL